MTDNLSDRNLSCRNKLHKEYWNETKKQNALKFEIQVSQKSKIKLLHTDIHPDMFWQILVYLLMM